MKKTILTVAWIFTIAAARATTVLWSAANDTGIVDASTNGTDNKGVVVAQGNLVRLGYFTISDAAVSLAKTNPSLLSSTSWHVIADTTIGIGTNLPGSFSLSSPVTLAAGDFGHQIYIWVLNAPTVGAATQQAIFYEPATGLPGQFNANWAFPGSNGPTISTTIDIGQAKTSLGGTYLAGSYQTSNASATTTFGAATGAVKLEAVVPEPSTFTLFALAAAAGAGLRRRSRLNPFGGALSN